MVRAVTTSGQIQYPIISDNRRENSLRAITMTNRNEKLRQIPPDWALWQKLYYQHQQGYIRQRLLAIKYLWLGKSRPEVTQLLGCTYVSLT